MSILIKGMEMPKNCDDCRFDIDCPYDESQDGYKMMGGRPRKCPLVPVPPHGRLIEAEPIMKFITDGLNSGEFGYDQIKVLTEIQYAPTIIPAEEGET